jgi:hypothetical protein
VASRRSSTRRHAGLCETSGCRRTGRVVCAAIFVASLLGSVLPQAAGADGLGFSLTPSKTEPYVVCGRPTTGHAGCMAILVPTASARFLSGTLRSSGPTETSPSYAGSGVGGGYDPANLRSAYDLPSESDGSGQTVAIVDAYDDPNAESDLATYRSRYGISACTASSGCFRKVNQSGGTTYPSRNASWAVEISLDLDMVSAACPNCHILLVEASSNSDSNLFAAENEAVALGATEISNSWDGEEFSGETSDDSYFNHSGVPITVAAGDEGYKVDYPAASRYVISVGGTSLSPASNSRGWAETAWSDTGSGCSAYETKPAWQTDSGCANRTDNDVAAVADPNTPVSVADSYELPADFPVPEAGWTLVGGTSVASPIVAGTMALSDGYTRSLGADAFYEDPDGLFDVISGSNGSCGSYLCNAGSGYDGPTGLGTPDGVPVASESSSTWAVTYPSTNGTEAFFVGAGDGRRVCYWNFTLEWSDNCLTGEAVASGSTPTAVTEPQTKGTTAFFAGAGAGRRVCYWQYNHEWNDNCLTGETVAEGSELAVVRYPSTGEQKVFFIGNSNRVCYWQYNGEWSDHCMTGETLAKGSS